MIFVDFRRYFEPVNFRRRFYGPTCFERCQGAWWWAVLAWRATALLRSHRPPSAWTRPEEILRSTERVRRWRKTQGIAFTFWETRLAFLGRFSKWSVKKKINLFLESFNFIINSIVFFQKFLQQKKGMTFGTQKKRNVKQRPTRVPRGWAPAAYLRHGGRSPSRPSRDPPAFRATTKRMAGAVKKGRRWREITFSLMIWFLSCCSLLTYYILTLCEFWTSR